MLTTRRIAGLSSTGKLDGTAALMANDDVDNLDLVELLISEAGATVRRARSGRDVLSGVGSRTGFLFDVSPPFMDS